MMIVMIYDDDDDDDYDNDDGDDGDHGTCYMCKGKKSHRIEISSKHTSKMVWNWWKKKRRKSTGRHLSLGKMNEPWGKLMDKSMKQRKDKSRKL